ncbi:MAG: peptidogalycan biosysnthesis protein [Dongiaceae bacterium]
MPVATHSAHWIADRGFAGAVADFLGRERATVEHERGALAGLSPFRRAAAPD